jgi:hypothetical protein
MFVDALSRALKAFESCPIASQPGFGIGGHLSWYSTEFITDTHSQSSY